MIKDNYILIILLKSYGFIFVKFFIDILEYHF